MQAKGIKRLLRRGDPAILANLTGYSVRTIRAMLQGERPLHPLVYEAAEKLVAQRRQRIEKKLEQ